MTLTVHEFLRRFMQHVLPRGFVRIRSFGFLANRVRDEQLTLCRQVLGVADTPTETGNPSRSSLSCSPSSLPSRRVTAAVRLDRGMPPHLHRDLRHDPQRRADGQTAVLGFPFNVGRPNPHSVPTSRSNLLTLPIQAP